jgi:NAD(P)H-nitrite reductase large subunit
MSYVIIGNSAAAIGAVEGIRKADQDTEIVIISHEKHHTYSRPLISYLLLGETDRQRMKYREDDFYEKNKVRVLLGRTVTEINPDRHTVTLDGGETVPYAKLLAATGSLPFEAPTPGLETVDPQFTFMSLDDALALEAAVTPQSRVLIIGGGLIGLKCAEGISQLAGSITVVDLAPRILSSILDDEGAEIIMEKLADNGISFRLNDRVERFEKNRAFLTSGTEIAFDVLVTAVGVRPNTALVQNAGGEVGRGIRVDEFMKTSLPDVYAAGDCTESLDVSAGQRRVLAILPNAYTQGECAGLNMAGVAKTYEKAIPVNAIGFFGTHIVTAGTYDGDVYTDTKNGYKKLFYKDGALKGYIIIGNIDKAGIYTSLIREQTPLSEIDFDYIKRNPGLAAFSTDARYKKLASVES